MTSVTVIGNVSILTVHTKQGNLIEGRDLDGLHQKIHEQYQKNHRRIIVNLEMLETMSREALLLFVSKFNPARNVSYPYLQLSFCGAQEKVRRLILEEECFVQIFKIYETQKQCLKNFRQ